MSHFQQHYIEDLVTQAILLKQQVLEDKTLIKTIHAVAEVCVNAFQQGNKVLLAGNGGSAGDSQHLAAEFVGRFKYDRPGLPAIALTTDSSMLTAIGNDYGYEKVFVRQLEANGKKGDVFIGISTSGNSKNVLAALNTAQKMGIIAVGLAGAGGAIQESCDYCMAVPSTDTARIQECHIMIGQIICAYVEEALFPKK